MKLRRAFLGLGAGIIGVCTIASCSFSTATTTTEEPAITTVYYGDGSDDEETFSSINYKELSTITETYYALSLSFKPSEAITITSITYNVKKIKEFDYSPLCYSSILSKKTLTFNSIVQASSAQNYEVLAEGEITVSINREVKETEWFCFIVATGSKKETYSSISISYTKA